MTPELTGWHTSTRSGQSSNCVEVGRTLEGALVGVRDTKDRAGGLVVVASAAWAAFVNDLQDE